MLTLARINQPARRLYLFGNSLCDLVLYSLSIVVGHRMPHQNIDRRNGLSVKPGVPTVVYGHERAIEVHATVNAFRAAERNDVRRDAFFSSRADRTGCDASIGTQLNLIVEQAVQTLFGHYQHYDLRFLDTGLKAQAGGGYRIECGAGPVAGFLVTRQQYCAAARAADYETGFPYFRRDHDRFRGIEMATNPGHLRVVLEILERLLRFGRQLLRLARGKRWMDRAQQGNR